MLNEDVEKAYKELRDFIVKELEKQQADGVFVSLKRASGWWDDDTDEKIPLICHNSIFVQFHLILYGRMPL